MSFPLDPTSLAPTSLDPTRSQPSGFGRFRSLVAALAAAGVVAGALGPAYAQKSPADVAAQVKTVESQLREAEAGKENAAAHTLNAIERLQQMDPTRDVSAWRNKAEDAFAAHHFGSWAAIKARDIRFWLDDLGSQKGLYERAGSAQDFARIVAKFDLGGTLARMESRLAKDSSLLEKNRKTVETMRGFQEKANKHADFVAEEAARMGASAREYQEVTLLDARRLAREAVVLTDAGLKLSPRHAALTSGRPALDAMAKDLDKRFEAKVYTSPFHKKNAGMVVFSSAPLAPGKESASAVKKAFKAGEPIYAGIYLDGMLRELVNSGTSAAAVSVVLYAGGDQVGKFDYAVPGAENEKSFLALEIFPPDAAKAVSAREALAMSSALDDLAPGEHDIEIRVFARQHGMSDNVKLATGEFAFNGTTGMATVKERFEALYARVVEETRMPKAKKKDGGLEKSMMAAIGTAGWKEKPVRAVITEGEWTQYRNKLTGILLSRDIAATVAVKDAEGNCKAFDLRMYQEAAGSSFGKTQLGVVYGDVPIDCDNVNK